MAITVLSDVILSNRVIRAGVRGKQLRRNSRVTTDSGAEYANVVWAQTLRQYEVGIKPMRRETWMDIEALHEVTEGGAYGFLMEDPKDNEVTVANGKAYSLTSTTFQLYKRYLDSGSSRYKDRKITRPRAASFTIYNSGVAIPGGSYTLNAETGVVTIPSAPTASNLTWAGGFYVPVHFMDDSIDWEMVLAGPVVDGRLLAGPSTVLVEIRE
jgi:uncharacterized protein (TIGR02217 family)